MTQDQIGLIASVVATVAALVALRFDMFGHAHGREEAFRRVGGWTIAVLGAALTGVGAYVWLSAAGVPPARQPDAIPVVAGVLGLALAVTGVVRVARTPAEPDVEALRHIVRTLGARLDRMEPPRRWIVDPLVTVERRTVVDERPISRLPRRNAKVTFVVGEAGAGKSLALRELARERNRREMRRKRPREVALCVDLGALADEKSKPTAELIRGHVHRMVSDGDSVIVSDLRRLMEGRRRLTWILLFDGIDDMAAGREADGAETPAGCLDAIRQFVDSRSAFRAVVALRNAPVSRPDEDVLPLVPLTSTRQREMAVRRGLTPEDVGRLRSHLAGHPELARAAASPMVMGLLLDQVERSGTADLPRSPYELMEAITAERLEPVAGSLPTAGILQAAERLAARAIDAEHDAGDVARETEALIAAGIVRGVQPGAVVFAGRLFRDHYAARRLMSPAHGLDAGRLVTTPAWREPVTICLRLGADDIRESLLTAACDVLDAHMAGAGWAVADVTPYLTPGGKSSSVPTPTVAMSWPAPVANVLDVLGRASSGGWSAADASRLTSLMDRIVVSAFVRGNGRARRHAAALLPLSSPEVVAWAVKRIERDDGSDGLMREAAERLASFPGTFLRLPGNVRLMLLMSALASPSTAGRLLRRPGSPDAGRPQDLAVLVRATMRLMQVLAVMGIGRSVADLVSVANGDTSLPAPWFSCSVIAGCVLFLTGSGGAHLRPLPWPLYPTMLFPILHAAFLAMRAVHLTGQAAVDFLRGWLSDAVMELLGAAVTSWPVALVLFMGWTGRLPDQPRDWLFPHLSPARAMFAHYFAGREPAEILRNLTRGVDRITVFRLVSAALLAGAGLVLVVRGIDLPNVAAAEQGNARGVVCVGLVLLGLLVDRLLTRWKGRLRRQHTARRVESGHLTAEEFLGLFQQAGDADHPGKGNREGSWKTPETDFLLHSLRDSPPRSLRHAMPAIRDLEAVLRHVGWLVPKDSRDPIPAGVWDYDPPAFGHPGFLQWVIEYDERFPGQLVRLAAARHDRIRSLVEQADA
ncbi:hypothetical protein HTZ77_43915 [Nonomuraea sp. SMC257]|uniref:NACHT domain-containing protein n=1 Tax=Nonomuraea montanisoli TaxID=2741721 RepID=A0A7Y6M889_9ACTN|nr:NACHT domain-containing protein [Nonomuraea montanisoli]NUW38297.1 hypothetical protein [Nonomuraea montanisoli]